MKWSSDQEFTLISESYYANGCKVDNESSTSSDCSITMTTGTQIKVKQSSEKDESDIDLPRIRYPLSKHQAQSKLKVKKDFKQKTTTDESEYHKESTRKEAATQDNKNKVAVKKENVPKALKPLRETSLSGDSLPDLSEHIHSSGHDKENGKNRHVKSKHSIHDEWKKYVPPLFSVAADMDDTQRESYGEKQRNLYKKFNDSLGRATSKHQPLYKAHSPVPNSKIKSEKTSGKMTVKSYRSPRKNQNQKSLCNFNSSVKFKVLRTKSADDVMDCKLRRRRKYGGKIKSGVRGHTFPGPHRKNKNRTRSLSEQSQSSVYTVNSFSSCPSSISSTSQIKSDVDSITDGEFSVNNQPFFDSDLSGDELDKINANIVKAREARKIRKRHKSFDQVKSSQCLKPIQRSYSCTIKSSIQSYDRSIFEILEEDISESDYSVKSEQEEEDRLSESCSSQFSPNIDAEKLKLQFEIFRKNLKKPKQMSQGETHNLPAIMSKYGCYQSDSTFQNVMKINDRVSDKDLRHSLTPSENYKVKQQCQEFRQKFKSAFQKATNKADNIQIKQSYDLPKISRHFLDVLSDSEMKQESNLDGIKSEIEGGDESPLPRIDYKTDKIGTWAAESSLANTELVRDRPLHRLDLSKANLYISSAPIRKIDLNKTELYLSELPVLEIDTEAKHFGIGNSDYNDARESEISSLIKQDMKNQPKITEYFMKKDEAIEEKIRHSSPKIEESDEAQKIDKIKINLSSIKGFQTRKGCKRKVKCQRLLHQKQNSSSYTCTLSSTLSQHTFVDSKLFEHDRQMKQLESLMQEARIECSAESAQNAVPHFLTDIIQASSEDGCVGLHHSLKFLNWFYTLYKPHADILTQVIETAFFSEVKTEHVYETFHLLQNINAKYPGQIEVEWKTIEKCLDTTVKGQAGDTSELPILQASLLLKLLIQVLKLGLYSKDVSTQVDLRKSIAYKLFSYDVHSPYPIALVNYIALLTANTETEDLLKSQGDSDMKMTIYVLIQELLSLAVEVSSSCVILAGQLAEEFRKVYMELAQTESRSVLVNSIRSDLIRYKLTELILESDYSGTRSLPARFPDSVIQIMECFSNAVPLKLNYPVVKKAHSNGGDDSPVGISQSFSPTDCEEVAMLLCYMVMSYLECCKKKTNQSLRSRMNNHSTAELATLKHTEDLILFPECVDDFLDHLLSLNSDLSPATEHYILLLQCLSDLVK